MSIQPEKMQNCSGKLKGRNQCNWCGEGSCILNAPGDGRRCDLDLFPAGCYAGTSEIQITAFIRVGKLVPEMEDRIGERFQSAFVRTAWAIMDALHDANHTADGLVRCLDILYGEFSCGQGS